MIYSFRGNLSFCLFRGGPHNSPKLNLLGKFQESLITLLDPQCWRFSFWCARRQCLYSISRQCRLKQSTQILNINVTEWQLHVTLRITKLCDFVQTLLLSPCLLFIFSVLNHVYQPAAVVKSETLVAGNFYINNYKMQISRVHCWYLTTDVIL